MRNLELINILYMIIPILLSISVHEAAHAYVAYKRGDTSQKYRGRLTLSPFAHMDIIGLLSLFLIGFGWGKPVEIDDRNFENRRKDMLMVALAGPAANLILAVVLALILKIMIVTGLYGKLMLNSMFAFLNFTIFYTIQLNVVLAAFNMIPLPPLDGSRLLFYFLPSKYREVEFFLTKYSFVILLVLVFTGISEAIISPVIKGISSLIMFIIGI